MRPNSAKTILLTAIFILSVASETYATDFETICNRMYEAYLTKNPSAQTINELKALMTSEGAFMNINYNAVDGSPRKHVQNLTTMACAYQHPQNVAYHQKDLEEAYLRGLRFWIKTDNRAKNW